MTYRDLLNLYDKKELPDDIQKEIEKDIERQDAISEYLFEKDSLLTEFTTDTENENSSVNSEEFHHMIKQSIRKAFIKAGIITGISVTVIIAFILFAVPRIISGFYYNPGKEVYPNTNQMSLDMQVYTELCIPGYSRDTVIVQDEGYGNYNIHIPQQISYNNRFTNIAGTINQGTLNLYDVNLLNPPTGNVFAWFQLEDHSASESLRDLEASGYNMFSSSGNRSQATQMLESLDEKEPYLFYATLDSTMSYDEFTAFKKNNTTYADWCAVYTADRVNNLGFQCELKNSCFLEWDRKTYPNMIVWNNDFNHSMPAEEIVDDSENMKTHFISMLQYMGNQKQFLKLMNETPEKYSSAADYIQNNGLTIYGYAGVTTKEELLKINELPEIYEIAVKELR